MTSNDKPSESSPDTLDESFFSTEPKTSVPPEETAQVHHDEPLVVARPSGAPVASSADDELSRVPDIAPDFDEDAVLGRKRGLHVGAFVVVLVCAVAGSIAGYRAFRPEPPKESGLPPVLETAAPKTVATPTTSASGPTVLASADASAKTNTTKASTTTKRSSSADGSGFSGANPNVTGPDAQLAKGELSAGEISGVVERNRALIRRQCWQPAVDARQGMGGSARVVASFTVAPSGAVQSSNATGAEADYPGLASCIAARVRTWQFPPSASSTPVNVPFVFAAQ